MIKKTITSLLITSAFSLPVIAEIAVIVHPSNTTSLDQETVERIFLGKASKFPNGNEAIPINLEKGAILDDFNNSVLGRSTAQVKSHWSKLIFTGKGTPPKEVSSDANVIELIANNQNTIGYVDASSITSSVRVVLTK